MSKNNWGNYTQSEVLSFDKGVVFMSYYTPVAIILKDGTAIKTEFSFSRTTSKQLSKFFNYNNVSVVNKVNKDLFISMLNEVGYQGDLGWLGNPYRG